MLEGSLRFVTVTLLRDPLVYAGTIALEYATSDLSARGVDSVQFAACQRLSVRERGAAGCGDYEQTSGVMVLSEQDMSGGFTVNIMDDLCHERFLEYIQVSLEEPIAYQSSDNAFRTHFLNPLLSITSKVCKFGRFILSSILNCVPCR